MMDVHVHLAALPDGRNGCFISPRMQKGWLIRMAARRLELPLEDPARANALYVERLLAALRASVHVRQAALLAMDGVYDSRGELDRHATEFLVSNDYALGTAQAHPAEFKAGVSINPHRRDAIEELERCAAAGAILEKVLPNAQSFDPSNRAYLPFWRRMARLRLPLLSHVGYEFSLIGRDQSQGDPARLRNALEEGVTVIAAHGLSLGLFVYEKYWNTFESLVRTYPNFYWDASALSLPNRSGMLLRIRRHRELWPRMVFGTDYPLPCFAYPAMLAGRFRDYWNLRRIRNPFDRHWRLLQVLGLEPQSFL